jgi:hypothetical protein
MQTTESLKQSIVTECEDDHVGLWSIIRDVENELRGANEAEIRRETLDILYELLKSGVIEAGFPDSNGRDFHPWPFPPQVIIDKIEKTWKSKASRPRLGEVVWFTKTGR